MINTYRAAAQTLADPTIPFWAKAAAVGKTVALGLSLVSAIKGAGGAGGASAGTASLGGDGTAGAVPNGGGGDSQMININLTGSRRDAVLEFIQLFNEAREDGALFSVNGAT